MGKNADLSKNHAFMSYLAQKNLLLYKIFL